MEEKLTKRQKYPTTKKAPRKEQNRLTSNRLELLITVVNRAKGDFYMDLIQSNSEVNMQFSTTAVGTADISILNKLGITSTDKTVIFSIIKSEQCSYILSLLEEKFKNIKDGNGIAYTVPMESIIGVSAFAFLANQRQGGLFEDVK